MNTLTGFLADPASLKEREPVSAQEEAVEAPITESSSVYDEQIQGLVQRLFLQGEQRARHVGFCAFDSGTDTFQVCLDVAYALAESGTADVGLIDAGLHSVPLHSRLNIEPDCSDRNQAVAPHLWLVPRSTWLGNCAGGRVWDPSLTNLRAATMEFDYSIALFDPLSWLTTRICRVCDGLVLVLTANKTRRLAAAEVNEQLRRARIPVLGTVLTERRFPVPEGLYRRL